MDPDHLKTIPLFSSLSDKALDTVGVFAREMSVSTGKRLVHEGDYSYDLIVIETGTADVIKDGQAIGSLGPGLHLRGVGMLSGGKRSADVIATSSMHLITLSKWDLKGISTEVAMEATGARAELPFIERTREKLYQRQPDGWRADNSQTETRGHDDSHNR